MLEGLFVYRWEDRVTSVVEIEVVVSKKKSPRY